jgi:hypothetical protein
VTRIGGAVLAVCAIGLAGCATFSQRYFMEVQECRTDWQGPHSMFIRLDLSGIAVFTVSKFEKGWYDKQAVDVLFSTLTSGDESMKTPRVEPLRATDLSYRQGVDQKDVADCTSDGARSGLSDRVTRVYGPNGRPVEDAAGKRLVIFATSNPDELVNRMATTVNLLATSEQFARLLRRNEILETRKAESALGLAGRRHEALIAETDSLLKWVKKVEADKQVDGAEAQSVVGGLVRKIDAILQVK